MTRILIVDDHAVVSGGLKQFLTNVGGFEVAGEARTGQDALRLVSTQSWDLLVLDIGLPDLNGLEVLKRIKRARPALPVLIFSMYAEDEYAITAREAGAAGYLPKDSPPDEILTALRRASAGECYLSPQFTEKLLSGTGTITRRLPHNRLSAREFNVMVMISRGCALIDIAEQLQLSPKTISTYRSRILEKLELKHNTEITRYVLKHKLDN